MSDQQAQAAETTAEATTQAAETGGEQITEESQPDILGQIDQRLNTWGEQLPNMVAQAVADQGYYEPEQDPYQQQQGFQQEQQDPYGGLDPNDPLQARLIQAEQRLAQFEQGQGRMQSEFWSRDLQQVLGKYPEMNPQHESFKPETSQAVMQSLAQAGYDVNQMVPPAAVEMAYKAHRADQIAAQQTPVNTEQQVTLEGGQAQQQQPDVDPVEEIFGKPQSVNPHFSWAVK